MKEAARQGLLGLGSKPLDSDHIQVRQQNLFFFIRVNVFRVVERFCL